MKEKAAMQHRVMHLFNASSLFTEDAMKEVFAIVNDREKLQKKCIEIKKMLLESYHFKVFNLPEDFKENSYVIATNHLTDSDAPLILSFYYDEMKDVFEEYPQLFVFAKENCFNGVSIPKEILPVLELEKVMMVDRTTAGGSMDTMIEAKNWFKRGPKPKDFLIFAQGTIYDINKEEAQDIEKGAFWLAKALGIKVLPAFLEQAKEGEDNFLVFGEPFEIPKNCRDLDPYKQLWIDKVIEAENSYEKFTGRKARETVLDDEHKVRKYHNGVKTEPGK